MQPKGRTLPERNSPFGCLIEETLDSDVSSSADGSAQNQRRSNRRDTEGRDDLPLHNATLQELLGDVLKHDDAWPFLRAVQKFEVSTQFRFRLFVKPSPSPGT